MGAEDRFMPGDTIADVRTKGFSIFTDAEGRKRRPRIRSHHEIRDAEPHGEAADRGSDLREPAHFVMERRMMLTIKRLAEQVQGA
jgi:hypothetical protein